MELPSTSLPHRASEPAWPHWTILASSLFLGICAIVCLKMAGSRSFLFAVSLGVLVVCALPWLVVLRRKGWRRRYPADGKWLSVVSVLLWISLLIGPLATGSCWVWARFSDAQDNMLRLNHALGTLAVGVVSFSTAYWSAALALLIQIWRDQWRPKLTGATIVFLLLLFAAYAFVLSPSSPRV